MLDRYQRLIKELKEDAKQGMVLMSMEFIQWLFEMEDMIKFLEFNVTSKEQNQRVEKLKAQLESVLKKLYVPDYQSKNV